MQQYTAPHRQYAVGPAPMACMRPTARGPLLLSFLLDRTSEQTCAQQVDAFSADLGSVLTKMGKSEAATFSVVGVDSNTSKIVVEVVIDSCDGQNSRTIFDSIETLEPFSAFEVVVAKDFKTIKTATPVDEKDAATRLRRLLSRYAPKRDRLFKQLSRPTSPPSVRLTQRPRSQASAASFRGPRT